MIVRGFKTLEGLEQKLREVPPEKRKVIVLVGRHPNEGTINIAQRHHEDWEKHGAVVVRIPAEWTPHGFWQTVFCGKLDPARVKDISSTIADDEALVSFLSRGRFAVPIVSFHGSPEGKRSLWDSQTEALRFYTDSANLHPHPDFEEVGAHMLSHPNAVAVEFYFEGRPSKGAALSRRAWKLMPHFPFLLSGQLYPSYLEAKTADSISIKVFSERFASKFDEVLAHLAKTGLKSAKH